MDRLRQYEIAFVGLKTGIHQFNFDIDDRFFAYFNNSLVNKGDLKVHLNFDKKPSFFILYFRIEGFVHLPCDRCSAELDFPLDADFTIVVKFDDHSENEHDDSMADVIYIDRNETHLNTGQLIYEFINLSIPLHRINCDNLNNKKPCDYEILSRLVAPAPKKQKPPVDPRWKDLTKIKLN
ncbi:MAG: DUF177 domain-containing protein [Chitinophagales bacterium]|nr:DUF177 domain-containing protein [Chitinophagales bacterium]